ncbi:MAG TPA: adenylate/guanylate cyclase domain-containing protein [Burkholderiaceae bacterium]|nr:adenylate/guanylate cyclase domain-containing protein [Burkholderiaceae bacterium]
MAESGARILVADDNKVNRLLLIRSLEQLGHRGAGAENGRLALELLEQQNFDLLLLDIAMPEMDGFQVLQHLTASPRLRDLPVIVTSALEDLDSVVRCIELGADDYLRKPVNPVLLRARVQSSLEKKRLRDEQREMVRRFATSEVEQDLERSGFALGGRHLTATVMFADLCGFTALCEQQSADETIELLNTYYTLMFDAISGQGGVINQMIGDGLMAIFGAPLPLADAGSRAVRAALEMIEMIELLNVERVAAGRAPLAIGVGLATGDVIAGYTGTQRRATYTCVGRTVNLAARLEAHTRVAAHAILVDDATRATLPAELATQALGAAQFKGIAGPTEVHAVAPRGAS